jgi:hypothetical protein
LKCFNSERAVKIESEYFVFEVSKKETQEEKCLAWKNMPWIDPGEK